MNQQYTRIKNGVKGRIVFGLLLSMLMLAAGPLMAQQRQVSGVVSDANGPLPGVAVTIKNTSHGVVTDRSGRYSIQAEPESVLHFSFIGYESQEVSVGSRTTIDVTMQDDAQAIDEIVKIGFGTVAKRDLTGSVSSVKSEEITLAPVADLMEAIQGKVAGLDIVRTSGLSGEKPEVLLRGTRSLYDDANEPLYIIDGIPGDYSTINMYDVESIEVLKDASSTAIYGSAGSNGVIIITTKQAQQGRTQVDFNAFYGINRNGLYPHGLTGQDYIDYKSHAYQAGYGTTPALSDLFSPAELEAIDKNQWVDWIDESLKTGVQQNYSLSVRSGNERTQGYFSMNYSGEDGVFHKDNNNLYTTSAGIDVQVRPWLKAGIKTYVNFRNRNSRNSRLTKAFSSIPLGVPYDEDGNINLYPFPGDETTISPLADLIDGAYLKNSKSIGARINPYLEITPIKGLTYTTTFSANLNSSRTGTFYSENSHDSAAANLDYKRAIYQTSLGYSYRWENIVNYKFQVNDIHRFDVTALSSYSYSRSESSSTTADGFEYDSFLWYYMQGATDWIGSSSYRMSKSMAYAGRINYVLKDKYLFTYSHRWDGSSVLYKDNRWDNFPAGAAAWRISEEDFMEPTRKWLNNLKLRVSYGVTGNSNIDPYQSTSLVSGTGQPLSLDGVTNLTTYMYQQAMGNRNLRWEKSYSANFGLDIGLFNNRIDVSMDYYNTITKDVLWERNLPTTLGGTGNKATYYMVSNIAKTKNRGFELTLSSCNISTPSFRWNSTVTFSTNKEKITDIDMGSGATGESLSSSGLFMGKPIKTHYGYKKTGIWQLGEEAEAAEYGLTPGRIKIQTNYDEENGGYVHTYTANDRTILGHENPNWILGFQNNFYWKNFDLNVFVTARWGQTLNANILGYYNYDGSNIPNTYNYWTPTNPTNDYPEPNATLNKNSEAVFSSLNYVNGSYIKIRNITLGYTLPRAISQKFHVSRLRVYGTINNPLIISKSHLVKKWDPEARGADNFPLYRQLVFGVNVSF